MNKTSLSANYVFVRFLKIKEYLTIWQFMQYFTKNRDPQTIDEIWFLEHDPIYTLGQKGSMQHVLEPSIPIIQSDRGGEVTYHGPGQLIAYVLIDLTRKGLSLANLIKTILESVVEMLDLEYGIQAEINLHNPGVYIKQDKICCIGLKVHKGCTYHGFSLNVNMDLLPFNKINPCGMPGVTMVQIQDLLDLTTTSGTTKLNIMLVAQQLKKVFLAKLNYFELLAI